MRQSFMEVDLDNFNYNLKQIQKYIKEGVKIMPVIKANAYGTYINKDLDTINKFDIVAVAMVEEGIILRKIGYKKEIFILNQPDIEEIDEIIENDLVVGISSFEFLKALNNIKSKIKIHIELETGMGRTGVNKQELSEFIKLIKENSKIEVEGAYTHLSSADFDFDYTNKQIKIFEEDVKKIKESFDLKYVHAQASNGILNFKIEECNLVRPGLILYGYESFENLTEKLDMKPVAKLKARINYIKEVEEGTSISYSRRFITDKKSKIATVPIGYADGISRELSNKGFVSLNGKKAPIIGSVCMDSFMIDITDFENVSVGDFVYIWDNETIKLDEIAQSCNTINYEIISRISERVPRVMLKK